MKVLVGQLWAAGPALGSSALKQLFLKIPVMVSVKLTDMFRLSLIHQNV